MAETHDKLYSLEQMQILMTVAASKDPMQEAIGVHNRWTYILSVAEAAKQGKIIDQLPQVALNPDAAIERANGIIAVLDEWLAERKGRRG